MVSEGRCYACFRPLEACFCGSIPSIDNRTEVLILQHRRERFHRFNTARIVRKGLLNSRLLTDHTANLARRLRLKPRSGLLYPGPTATLVSDLPIDRRPEQLVVVDGTWHHAKTLVRDIPALQDLPRYQLAPTAPSRYRIRREPNAMSLSTVEAAVAALRILEPETDGFERLLAAFETMVDMQLAHPGSLKGARFKERRSRTVKNIPLALHGGLDNIVVAYGEAAAGERGRKHNVGPPLVWVARRLGDGSDFACTLEPSRPLGDAFLGHLELTRADFAAALPLAEARTRWARFRRSGDIVTVMHPGTTRLFKHLAEEPADCLLLKAVDLPAELLPATDRLTGSPALGRASKRLAETIALVRRLNDLVNRREVVGMPAAVATISAV